MSKKRKHPRLPAAHAFGPAYGKWLDLLEGYEDYISGRIPLRKLKPFTYNDEIFNLADLFHPDSSRKETAFYLNLLRIWGANAASLRSSFKFKIEETQWVQWSGKTMLMAADQHRENVSDEIESEYRRALSNMPFQVAEEWFTRRDGLQVTTYLPFENVFIQYEGHSGRSILALCERRTLDKDYPELGLLAGESFICLTPAGYNNNGFKGEPNEKLGCYPIEIHFREGVEWTGQVVQGDGDNVGLEWSCPAEDGNDCPPMIEAAPKGVRAKNWELRNHSGPYMNALFALLAMLSNGGVKQTNHGTVKPENVIRRKPLHKKQHPMYEYRVLELGLGDEEPIVNVQIPRECAKKRLHAVRGFFRHYKKPLKSGPNKGKTKVFVREHWRGEKELGVVRKDYIFENGSEIPETV